VRELRFSQKILREKVAALSQFVFEEDPENQSGMVVSAKAVDGMNKLMTQNLKYLATLCKMQKESDENVSSALFTLVSYIKRVGGMAGVDEEVLRNPQTSAGTMIASGSSIKTATNTNRIAGVALSMYSMSGF
jgi:hypothetical protein